MFLSHEVTVLGFFLQEEVEPSQQMKRAGAVQDMEKALAEKTKVVEELTEELEDIRDTFGTDGVQQVLLLELTINSSTWKYITTDALSIARLIPVIHMKTLHI